MDDAVAHSEIDDAIHRERRREDVLRLEVETPGEPEPSDGCGVDLGKRAVVCLAKGATVRRPVAAVAVVGEVRSSMMVGAAIARPQAQPIASASSSTVPNSPCRPSRLCIATFRSIPSQARSLDERLPSVLDP